MRPTDPVVGDATARPISNRRAEGATSEILSLFRLGSGMKEGIKEVSR